MKRLTLLFKRGKKEGFDEPHFSLTTTSTPATMRSPSQSQKINPQSPQQEEGKAEDSTPTLESLNPTVESDAFNPPPQDPDHEIVLDQQEEEAEEDHENPGMSAFPPAPSPATNVSDVTMSSSSYNPGKRGYKRKKGKGITSVKKQQAIEKKKQTLLEKLNPVPFIPSKTLDFVKHEKLLKKLGLWDFVHLEFDRNNIRVDLIAQLVATYDPKLRYSYVNDCRILVNRADLARAFKLPVKKEKSCNVVADAADFDIEALSEESIAFLEDFVSNWVLLHEDAWMMPGEVLNWTKAIKDGHPEKVDWAGLFWFMVEKELTKGEQLIDCYYASHLQHLIKSQREEVLGREAEEGFSRENPEKVDLTEERQNVDFNKELQEDGGGNEGNVRTGSGSEVHEEEDGMLQGPNVELTLGQDSREEGTKEAEMVDVEDCKDDDEEQEQEQQHWLLHGKNDGRQHFMQRCTIEERGELDSLVEGREEDDVDVEEEEEGEEGEGEDGFDVIPGEYPSVGGEGLTGNFLQALETNQIAFGSQGQLHDQSSVDLLASRNELQHMAAAGPSFYINDGKTEIVHDHDVPHHSLNGSNKRLRIDGPWDRRPSDSGTCFDQMQQLVESARIMFEEKKQALEDSNLQKQIIINEVQKRDAMIEQLHQKKCEEIQKRDLEIFRLRRELYLMGNLVEEYRNALKESNRAFSEYRKQHQLAEEPIYQDAGPGGVMLTTAEMEKRRLQQEEYRNNCSMLEQMVKETEEALEAQFGDHLEKVICLDKRLEVHSRDFKILRDLYLKSKVSQTDEKVSGASECPPTD